MKQNWQKSAQFEKYNPDINDGKILKNAARETLLTEVFDYLRLQFLTRNHPEHYPDSNKHQQGSKGAPKDKKDPISPLLSVWTTFRAVYNVLKFGYSGSETDAIQKLRNEVAQSRAMFLDSNLKKNYHIYEHILFDHYEELLADHPGGIACFSQTSQERENGIQQQFVSTLCFSGSKRTSSNGNILKDDDDDTEKSIESMSPSERVELTQISGILRDTTTEIQLNAPDEIYPDPIRTPTEEAIPVQPNWKVLNTVKFRESGSKKTDYFSMTVKELRAECKLHHLKTSGRKEELQFRLQTTNSAYYKVLKLNRREQLARQLLYLFLLMSCDDVTQLWKDKHQIEKIYAMREGGTKQKRMRRERLVERKKGRILYRPKLSIVQK